MSVRWRLAAVVALALAVRLTVVLATPDWAPRTDSVDYDASAVTLAHEGRFPISRVTLVPSPTAFRPPLFPFALSAVYRVVGTSSLHTRWQAGRVLEALLGAVAVGLLFLIALELWGLRRASWTGALAAIYPPLVLVGSSLMVEPLFIALELGAVLAALRSRAGGGMRWALGAGLLAGLGALTRGNGLVLCLPLCLLAIPGGVRRRRGWRPAIVVLLAAAVTVLPWAVRDLAVFHRPVALTTETGIALAGTYNAAAQANPRFPALWMVPIAATAAILREHPRIDEAAESSALTHDAVGYIERHPVSLVRTAGWTALRLLDLPGPAVERLAAPGDAYPLWLAVMSVYAFWLTGGLALVGLWRGAARGAPAALWWCPAVIILSALFILGTTRYRAPADPYLLLLAAGAFAAGRPARRRPASGEDGGVARATIRGR